MRVRTAAAAACGVIALAGTAYGLLAVLAMRRFRAARREPAEFAPPLTVIRPLHGDEPELFERLCAICEQTYPVYQVLFSVKHPADPAAAIARRVIARYPGRDLRLIAGEARAYANPKIGNIAGAFPYARHDLIVMLDSDIAVGPAYLRRIAACFADERVGAATALYGAKPIGGLPAQLAALFVGDQFAPSVLVAQMLGPIDFCFGATMAVRRDVLKRIGGLQRLGAYLADDYLLGKRTASCGYRVALSPHPVETICVERTAGELFTHELRWARTIRAMRPIGFAGSIVTYPLPFALLAALLRPAPATVALACASLALRALVHDEARATFAPGSPRRYALLLLRDTLGIAVWLGAFTGRRVRWRSDAFGIEAAGRMACEPEGNVRIP